MTEHDQDHCANRDRELEGLLSSLDPAPHRLAQIEDLVLSTVGRGEGSEIRRSLTAEWIELLRVRPLFTTGVAFAGSAALLLLSPLAGVLVTILS